MSSLFLGVNPVLLFVSLFFGSFVSEDLAFLIAMALAEDKVISIKLAGFASFSGIWISDLGLYFLGRMALEKEWARKWLSRWSTGEQEKSLLARIHGLKLRYSLSVSIFISRLMPGTRVPLYVAAGLMRMNVFRFVALTFIAVSLWTLLGVAFVGTDVGTGGPNGSSLMGISNWTFVYFYLAYLILKLLYRAVTRRNALSKH